jgi:hypothetical protein
MVDSGRVVDVDGEVAGALQLDREHLDAVESVLDASADVALQLLLLLPYVRHETSPCHKKWARRPISPNR